MSYRKETMLLTATKHLFAFFEGCLALNVSDDITLAAADALSVLIENYDSDTEEVMLSSNMLLPVLKYLQTALKLLPEQTYLAKTEFHHLSADLKFAALTLFLLSKQDSTQVCVPYTAISENFDAPVMLYWSTEFRSR